MIKRILHMTGDVGQKMLDHIIRQVPEEACGLIGGKDNIGTIAIPITNSLHSLVKYRMDPYEQVNAFIWLEKNQLDLVAIYHSHPQGPGFPSPEDLEEFYYPGVFSLIWYPKGKRFKCKCFVIKGEQYSQVRITWDS